MSATLLPTPAPLNPRTVRRQRIFTATGSFTAPAGVTAADVLLVSGGGAGFYNSAAASASSGGGGGGVAARTVALTPGATYAIAVGIGGAAAASNTYGGHGGTTSAFGLTVTGGRRAAPTTLPIALPGAFGSGFGSLSAAVSPGVLTAWGRFGNGGAVNGVAEGGNGYAQPGDPGVAGNGGAPPTPGEGSGHGGNGPSNSTQVSTSGASGIVIVEWEEPA